MRNLAENYQVLEDYILYLEDNISVYFYCLMRRGKENEKNKHIDYCSIII